MLIINKNTAFKAIFVLHNRYIKRLIYIMYSNMASRQWFIRVKSNTDKQKNRLRHPYTDFKSRRTKFAPTVSKINIYEDFVPLSRHRCVESPHPTNARQ